MKLAKDCIDIGVQTNQREPMLAFWQEEAGLPFEELLKVGPLVATPPEGPSTSK